MSERERESERDREWALRTWRRSAIAGEAVGSPSGLQPPEASIHFKISSINFLNCAGPYTQGTCCQETSPPNWVLRGFDAVFLADTTALNVFVLVFSMSMPPV